MSDFFKAFALLLVLPAVGAGMLGAFFDATLLNWAGFLAVLSIACGVVALAFDHKPEQDHRPKWVVLVTPCR